VPSRSSRRINAEDRTLGYDIRVIYLATKDYGITFAIIIIWHASANLRDDIRDDEKPFLSKRQTFFSNETRYIPARCSRTANLRYWPRRLFSSKRFLSSYLSRLLRGPRMIDDYCCYSAVSIVKLRLSLILKCEKEILSAFSPYLPLPRLLSFHNLRVILLDEL